MAACGGGDVMTEPAGPDASGCADGLADRNGVPTCRRSSKSSRCSASFCCDVCCANSSTRRRNFRCRNTAEMARTGVAKTNSANNTARSSKGYPLYDSDSMLRDKQRSSDGYTVATTNIENELAARDG